MITSLLFITLIFLVSVALARLTGKHMARVYKSEKDILDFLKPFEKLLFRLCRVDPEHNMSWKEYLTAFLVIQIPFFAEGFVVLLFQGSFPFNPAGNPSMEWTLALHSAGSFLTSTNLQYYSGESGATYLSQVGVFMFLQFVSAACSLSAGIALVRGLSPASAGKLGNFYRDFVLSMTRILLPLCILVSTLFVFSGVPMTLEGPDTVQTLQGDSAVVARGPVAAFLSIKELGSNGGGFFGANDAHPFENPSLITFALHSVVVFLLPMAFIFMTGRYLGQKKFSRLTFGIMTAGFLLVTVPVMITEGQNSPAVEAAGIYTAQGNMEGKETRFGALYSAFYSGENAVIPAGTVTGMHDSYLPLSGLLMLFGMQTDAFFGGLGSGWINYFIYLLLAAFIGTLMIGRTPELFGKKIGAREIQITSLVYITQPLVVFTLAALACFVLGIFGNEALGWLGNPGAHGFTSMLYEFTSSYAGNGSGFESLGDNTPFWNISTAAAMLTGRYVPVTGAIIIAGLLSQKTAAAPTAGTLKTDSRIFGIFTFFLIIILSGLSMLISFLLGPLADHFYVP